MEIILKDTTSKVISVFLRDSETGLGKTGVLAADLTGEYTLGNNAAATALAFATGSVGDAFSAGKWAEVGNGEYYYHAPNAMFAQHGTVVAKFRASGVIDAKKEFQVVAFDPYNSAYEKLLASAGQILLGTVDTATNSHTPTVNEFQADDITEATADHYKGRIVIFRTGNLTGQAAEIINYSQVGGIGQFTVSTLTEAPANDDMFIIV